MPRQRLVIDTETGAEEYVPFTAAEEAARDAEEAAEQTARQQREAKVQTRRALAAKVKAGNATPPEIQQALAELFGG